MDTGSQPRRVAPHQSTDGHGESASEGSSTPVDRWTRGVSLGGKLHTSQQMDTGSQPRKVTPHQSTDGHGESVGGSPYQDGHMESARRVAPHRPTDGHGESVSEGSSKPAI